MTETRKQCASCSKNLKIWPRRDSGRRLDVNETSDDAAARRFVSVGW